MNTPKSHCCKSCKGSGKYKGKKECNRCDGSGLNARKAFGAIYELFNAIDITKVIKRPAQKNRPNKRIWDKASSDLKPTLS